MTVDNIEVQDIPGFAGQYAVSRSGEVWSYNKRTNANAKGMWLSRENRGGYHRVFLFTPQKNRIMVHRAVALTYIPNPDNKPFVNHIDGDKLNNDVSNLEWCTTKENTRHAFDTGLRFIPKGEKSPAAKLTDKQVQQIRDYGYTHTAKELASMFGVGHAHISNIRSGRQRRLATA